MNQSAAGDAAHGREMEAREVYARLLRYAKPFWRMYLLGVVGMVLYALSDATVLYFLRYFLNDAFLKSNARLLAWLPLAVIGLFTLRGVGDFGANYFPSWVGRQVIGAIRGDLFAKYLRLPTAYYDREASANMLSRLIYNSEQVASSITDSSTVIIRDSLSIVGYLIWMVYLNWELALFSLLIAPVIATLVGKINQRFRRYSKRIQNSMGDVTRVSKEALDAHRVVKVFNAQEHIGALFEETNERNRRSNIRLISARSSSNPIVQLIASLGLAGVLFVAIPRVARGDLKSTDFIVFVTAMIGISQPLRRVLNVSGPMQQGIAAGASVFEVLDDVAEPKGGTRSLQRARGAVEFRDVNFEYTSEKGVVLHNINLSVQPGATIAIVGRSGSGKSTLVSLLPRFYDPTSGSVQIDGVDIREYPLTDLRRQISLVSQEVVIFNESIRNNILFGATDISEERLQAAVRAAYVHEFVEQLPDGLDTMVGDRGALLSGGQRQRVVIARALLRDTPILILDEATSALDTSAERHIQAALDQLVRNRTTFVIAHRLSTVEHADCILVMREGSIIESGPHAQLLAEGGVYAELHRLQFNDG